MRYSEKPAIPLASIRERAVPADPEQRRMLRLKSQRRPLRSSPVSVIFLALAALVVIVIAAVVLTSQ